MRARVIAAAWTALAAAAATAAAQPGVEGKGKKPERTVVAGFAVDLPVEASVAGGVRDGRGVRREGGAVWLLQARATPGAERGAFRLELPLRAEHEQLFGANLDETSGEAGLELRYRSGPRLRVTAGAALEATWRPDWPDLYQPLGDGSYGATDRFSYWERRVELGVAAMPIRHHHARARYRYRLFDYRNDPAFEPVAAPTHLAPFDRSRHEVDLSWRYLGAGWKLGAECELFREESFYLFARDAGTGRTHAPPGGAPPNPLQTLQGAEPAVEGEVDLLHGALVLSGGYGLELVDDTYQGYYSYVGHHPRVGAAGRSGPLEARLDVDVRLRRYGDGSYMEGSGHPPLLWGDRRADRRVTTTLAGAWTLADGLALTLEVRAVVRRTNFPPYVAETYPAGRDYDIDWSYDNWLAVAGVAFRR